MHNYTDDLMNIYSNTARGKNVPPVDDSISQGGKAVRGNQQSTFDQYFGGGKTNGPPTINENTNTSDNGSVDFNMLLESTIQLLEKAKSSAKLTSEKNYISTLQESIKELME